MRREVFANPEALASRARNPIGFHFMLQDLSLFKTVETLVLSPMNISTSLFGIPHQEKKTLTLG